MSQCLRCSGPCETTSVFCEPCRSFLRSQLWQEANIRPEAPVAASPVVVMPFESGDVNRDFLERITGPQPIVSVSQPPQTPQPTPSLLSGAYAPAPIDALSLSPGQEAEAFLPGKQEQSSGLAQADGKENGGLGNKVDQALHRLSEAAQRIAEIDQNSRRVPRASRLSPMRDISADIQRHSTPLPGLSKEFEGAKTVEVPASAQEEDLGKRLPDLWPWLQEDADPEENDHWSNHNDPLIARQFPNSTEANRIEEEDLRRAAAAGLVTLPISPRRQSALALLLPLTQTGSSLPAHRRLAGKLPIFFTPYRTRRAFAIFIILAIVFLVADSVLLSVVFMHPHRSVPLVSGPPSLTLSTNAAKVEQAVTLHIRNFSSDTNVLLTHDIQEDVQLTAGSPKVAVGADGSADVTMVVDGSWGPGFHTIEAEGFTTRYTASATLQILGEGTTQPSRLLIGAAIDLGADYQGANTIRPLTLHNSGDGSISWAASSNQPWLLVSPAQGVFSASQTITIAGERSNLKAGDYKGTISFSSNQGSLQAIQVHMSVRPLPPNVGAVLEVTPPVLSFTALDGGSNPNGQALVVNNPGSQPLHWSLTGNNPMNLAAQDLLNTFNPGTSWLSASLSSGVVPPHGTNLIQIAVNSSNLLPGVYTNVLAFAGSSGALNSPQSVSISLTVQSRCGLTVNTGLMSFTAVSGHGNPGNRSLSLSSTASCTGGISWKAVPGVSWLSVTPASGQLKGSAAAVTTVAVNAASLKPGTYAGNISFIAPQSTQTVMVQLVVQPPPPPSAPIMGAAPLTLNFNTTQGIANPPQLVTITNTGKSQLNWHTTVNTLASSWLVAGPTGGTIAPGQTGHVTINISTANLAPNSYVGQVILIGTDANGVTAAGSPQTITVNLLVLPPCTLEQPSLTDVAFSAVQGTANPDPQPIALTASGNCGWPLRWQARVKTPSPWLTLTPASGSLVASGQSSTMTLTASINGLATGTYTTKINLNASGDSNTDVQGTPQTISVTLNVLAPCSLQVGTANLTFTVAQGQPAPPAQNFALSESGSCARPVSWSASASSGSGTWLVLAQPSSGKNNGTVNVGINPQNMTPGTYTGTITVTASGNGGAVVQGSPQTINVTLTVTGYTLSGTVMACSDSTCSSTKALPGASINLVNHTTNQTINKVADATGAYSFTNLALGSYTYTVTGSDGTLNYSGTATFNLTGNQSNYPMNTYPV